MIRDGRYVVPDVIWKSPDGDRHAAHIVRRNRDASIVIEFEDDDGLRSVRVHPSQLEVLR